MEKNTVNNITSTNNTKIQATPKQNNKKNIQSIKGNILLLANKLLNDKKINKSAYNKMYNLYLNKSRLDTLEDAYNALNKIKDSDVKVHAKDFKKMKSEEKEKRAPDKFMLMVKNKQKEIKLHRYHLTAQIRRKITYINKNQVKNTYTKKKTIIKNW
jgi:hypothetical protein